MEKIQKEEYLMPCEVYLYNDFITQVKNWSGDKTDDWLKHKEFKDIYDIEMEHARELIKIFEKNIKEQYKGWKLENGCCIKLFRHFTSIFYNIDKTNSSIEANKICKFALIAVMCEYNETYHFLKE